MAKTLSTLNETIWYRFTKVIYIIFFILIFGFGNSIIFNNKFFKLNLESSTFACNRSSGIKTYKFSELPVYYGDLNNYTYASFYSNPNNEELIQNILKKCNPSFASNIYDFQRFFDIKNSEPNFNPNNNEQIWRNRIAQDKTKNPAVEYNNHLFDLYPIYSSNGFLSALMIFNSLILFIFILIQKIFYYIVLGSINSKTNND